MSNILVVVDVQKDFRTLVPKNIYNYIKKNNLYVDSTKIKGD